MNKPADRFFDLMAFAAAGILFFLACLTTFDVVGRRFFDSPVTGTIEIVELGTAIAAFLAMPRAFLTNAHVSAEFLDRISAGGFGAFIAVFRGVLMVGMVSLLAYATTIKAIDLMDGRRVTIELELPFFPFTTIIAIALWCSAVAALLWTVRAMSSSQAS